MLVPAFSIGPAGAAAAEQPAARPFVLAVAFSVVSLVLVFAARFWRRFRRPLGCGGFVSRNLFWSRRCWLWWFLLVFVLRLVLALVFVRRRKKCAGEKSAGAKKVRGREERGGEKAGAGKARALARNGPR